MMKRAALVCTILLASHGAIAGPRKSTPQQKVIAGVTAVVQRERDLYFGLAEVPETRAPNFPCGQATALARQHEAGRIVFEQLLASRELSPRWRKKLGKLLDDSHIYLLGIDRHLVRLGCRQTA